MAWIYLELQQFFSLLSELVVFFDDMAAPYFHRVQFLLVYILHHATDNLIIPESLFNKSVILGRV